jgi:AcrR family transcriptional regulator
MREKVISAFMELTPVKGFYNVSVDELADKAGISKRTIYRYFRSKDEIIEAVIDCFMENMSREIEKIIETNKTPDEIFAQILDNFYRMGRPIINNMVFQDLRQHYPNYWKKIDEFRMKKAEKLIEVFIDSANKDYTREINPKVVTAAVLASIHAVLNPEFILSNGLSFNEAIEQLLEFFKHGFIR